MRSIFRLRIIIHRKIAWLLVFSICSLAIVSWLIYLSKINIDKSNAGISQAYDIIATAQEMIIAAPQHGAYAVRYLDSLQLLNTAANDQPEHFSLLQQYIQEKRPDSTVVALLYTIIQQEKNLLAVRKRINNRNNRRMAVGLVVGRTAGFLFVVIILIQLNKDISRRKETQEKLVIAMGEAQQSKLMQEQFLANMSHEIRTPMNGIKGMTDLLLGASLSDKQYEMTGMIKSSVNNLLVIINDILDFSKIQAGKLNIEYIDLNVREVLNGACAVFEHRLKKKGIALDVSVDAAVPHRLTGDPYRLNQVLTNLVGNAIKFTDRGHIRIRVAVKERRQEQVVILFTVTDTGIGIAADSLPYIFDSFSQAGRDISRRYGGTGLGLTICKQLLHLQEGDISATSEAGKGSEFSFYLPYGYALRQAQPLPAPRAIEDYSHLLEGRHFLVAEDNVINQKVIEMVLRKAGGSVSLVNNGHEAISYLEEGMPADLIIMDIQMPEMDGYAATQHIRSELHLQIPIIAMTATAIKGEQLQCLAAGMNDYMTKPFEFAELYKRIGALLV